MCRDPPPVKCRTTRRPWRSTAAALRKYLAFELPAAGGGGQKRKQTCEQRQCMYIPWCPHVRTAPAAFPPIPLPSSNHSSCRHTERTREGRGWLMYLCCTPASWNRHKGHCIISRFFYTPKYLICINFIAADSSYLPWIDLLCESPGSYHEI